MLSYGFLYFQEIFGPVIEPELYDLLQLITKQQLKMSDRWMKHFGVKIFIKEIKSISLSHIFHFESEPHILTFLQNLLRVAKKFSHLIANPIAYKMMFLLLLTTESQKMSKFPALQKTYLQMFWRKLNHTFVEKSNCNELVKELFSAIHYFQLLTDSMLQLLS